MICRLTQAKTLELEEFLRGIDGDSPALVVVLDHIEDPHNLGAVIRSAEAGGASGVIVAKRRSAIPNDTVIKTSAGASLRLPVVQVANITRTIERLKESGFWAVGLDAGAGSSLWDEKMPERCALVVGAEGEGLSRLVGETCDAAADAGDQKAVHRVRFGILNEFIHVGTNRLDAALHGGNGVALSSGTGAHAPFRAKEFVRHPGGAATMMSSKIAAEYKHLAFRQMRDVPGSLYFGMIRTHNDQVLIIWNRFHYNHYKGVCDRHGALDKASWATSPTQRCRRRATRA